MSAPLRLKEHPRTEIRKKESDDMKEGCEILYDRPDATIRPREITATSIACTRPVQDWAVKSQSWIRKGTMVPYSSMQATDGC